MRLDGRPVLFRSRTLPSISDGDQVAAAGPSTGGEFQAIAINNLTTNVIYAPPATMAIVLAVILIVLGIPLIAFLGFGLLFVGGVVYVLFKALQIRKAVSMLYGYRGPASATPAAPAAAAPGLLAGIAGRAVPVTATTARETAAVTAQAAGAGDDGVR